MQKITPFLWFNGKAEEAANFYVSIFDNSRIVKVAKYPEGTPGTPGSVMTVSFLLNGQEFVALNAGPDFPFTNAISFMVNCDTQQEVDKFWDKLCEGGEEIQCGWLKDKYGLSWQITPTALMDMTTSDDVEAASRAMKSMMGMKKIDIAAIQRAYQNA